MKGQFLGHSHKPSIALVDDDPIVTEAYASILADFYQVMIFNSPQEFLKYLDFHEVSPFEVLITDLRMPQIKGPELASKAQKKGFEFSTLLFSAYLDKTDILEALDSGIDKVIEKCSSTELILAAIDELVIENRIRKNHLQIRELILKLRESYQHVQLLIGDFFEARTATANAGKTDHPYHQVDNIEELLASLESRLDALLSEGKLLNERRKRNLAA